jgi:2'-5' RNA ligase
MLMSGQPQVRTLAAETQSVLSTFHGFHMTPLEWLHITTLVVGPAGEVSRDQFSDMIAAARETLHDVKPISVTARKFLYHPEAIMLSVAPSLNLRPIREAAHRATRTVLKRSDESTSGSSDWNPHVTIAYSTKEQLAGPIISTLGTTFPNLDFTVEELTLVVQWGEERLWDWEPVGTIRLS